MSHRILIINHRLNIAQLPADFTGKFEFITVADGRTGLVQLALEDQWCGMLVACELPDMGLLDFLNQAVTLTQAIPLLLVPDDHLPAALHLANSRSLFRVVPESTSGEILATILLDTARQFGLVLQEQELWERIDLMTVIDPLTGCLSRPHLEELLKKELRRSLRYTHPLAVILCDIDGLKGVNESLGHRVGDQILAGFARMAMESIRRDIDTITRWGEDEFLLVLPETPIRGGALVASRLRERFAGLNCAANGHLVSCTASFGVAGFTPEIAERNASPDDLLLIASRCLMQAKAAGGNQVLCCP
ncbi:diguanylate cyclase [Desulfobulbus propionicus DSM 2032]|uniref:diguanylate cyclase n=1 Tax=Desulfobulbus propionicus (strain ATCC 33891 / DSM 2032 / VKM B-1956 / 1pr3) TaxID=577650 RepID=A0A7U4DP66_DESPD|nr:GGDEF domain-containing protein [Desulfobulbus propionicus]ADW17724.1 diguanylate cyclase [Desulfobulbus propionicus DSM 2032]